MGWGHLLNARLASSLCVEELRSLSHDGGGAIWRQTHLVVLVVLARNGHAFWWRERDGRQVAPARPVVEDSYRQETARDKALGEVWS
eukprot:2695326-Pleurochrysis_carterae.AAC.1